MATEPHRVLGVLIPFRPFRPGDKAWVITSETGWTLTQVAPIGGQVLAVNMDLLKDPTRLTQSPYTHGWVLCLQSGTIPDQVRRLLSHEADQLLLDRTRSTMASVLGSPLRLPLKESGWDPGFGDGFGDEEWETLRQRLFPVCRDCPSLGRARS